MKLKNQKGITLTDVALSIFIVAIFVTINVSLSYNALLKATSAQRSERAIYYATQIAEYVQGLDSIDEQNSPYIDLSSLDIPSGYRCIALVENPIYENINEPQDLIKIVNINVSYNVGNTENQFELKTLKINKE